MKPPSFEGDNPGKKDTWNISISDITKLQVVKYFIIGILLTAVDPLTENSRNDSRQLLRELVMNID